MSERFHVAQVYRDVEDHLVPYLRLSMAERAVYYHLLRHTRLEGRRVVQVSKRSLSRDIGCCFMTVHRHVRRLAQKGCLRIVERGRAGHSIEVLTPDEIAGHLPSSEAVQAAELETADCFRNQRLRSAILRREQYACFYCLRQLAAGAAAFDHAVPVAAGGGNSYRNIVACCFDCNSLKRDRPAPEFLRELYRAERLSAAELDARLAALQVLQTGKLLPQLRLDAERAAAHVAQVPAADRKGRGLT